MSFGDFYTGVARGWAMLEADRLRSGRGVASFDHPSCYTSVLLLLVCSCFPTLPPA